MKILQVSDAFYPFPGGVSEHLYNLSLALRKLGHEVHVLTANYGKLNGFKDPPWVHRVGKIWITPAFKLFNATQLTLTFHHKVFFEVRQFFRNNWFTIIHTHGPLALNLPTIALHYGRGTHVATFHTAFIGFNWHRIGKLFFKKYARKIKIFIPVSEVAEKAIKPHYPGKYIVVPNGIDTERFRPDGPLPEEKYERPIILYVGRMEPRKGFPYLLRAFIEFKRKNKKGTLVAIGKGTFLEKYKALVPDKLKNSVVFKGFIEPEKLPEYYRFADVFTSPAIGGETFGIVLLEAMASGTPVVASDIEGYRIVIRNGENGILVNIKDPVSYRKALEVVLFNKGFAEKIRKKGLEFARKHDWLKIAEKIIEVYKLALKL